MGWHGAWHLLCIHLIKIGVCSLFHVSIFVVLSLAVLFLFESSNTECVPICLIVLQILALPEAHVWVLWGALGLVPIAHFLDMMDPAQAQLFAPPLNPFLWHSIPLLCAARVSAQGPAFLDGVPVRWFKTDYLCLYLIHGRLAEVGRQIAAQLFFCNVLSFQFPFSLVSQEHEQEVCCLRTCPSDRCHSF